MFTKHGGPGRCRPRVKGAREGVVAEDHRGGRVIRVAEPCLVPALGPFPDPADGPDPGQFKRGHEFPAGQVVHADLADRVPGARHDENGPRQFIAVEDRVAAQHRRRVLGDEVPPAVGTGRGRVGDADPAARRVQVGEHVQPSVPSDPRGGHRVAPHHERHEHRGGEVARRKVGDPDVFARRGPDRRGNDQPASVPADAHPEVTGFLLLRPEHFRVRFRRRPHHVQVDPPVVHRFTLGNRVGRQPPGVVERLAARQPCHA